MALLSEALEAARTYLNDDAASLWSDATLIPKCKEAHRELQTMLWSVGSPAVRKQSAPITVTASALDLGGSQPADLLTPFKLVEFAATVETIADAIPMTETNYLPSRAVQSTLIHWAWKEEKIVFVGASADRKVVLYYRKLIPVPAASTDAIGVMFGELYIGARAAALAHGATGNKEQFEAISAIAKENFSKVVASQRGQQTPMMKP